MSAGRGYVAVIGPGDAPPEDQYDAYEVGRLLAKAGFAVVTGGLGGVMAAACRGANDEGGLTIGIQPGGERVVSEAKVTIPTGLGEARNLLVVRAADAVVAVGRSYGTLSEIAFALQTGRRVAGLRSWDVDGVHRVETPGAAVATAVGS